MQHPPRPKDKNTLMLMKKQVRTLSKLPGLSDVVREILRGWIEISDFVASTTGINLSISTFQTVTDEEYTFLNRLANRSDAQFTNNPEYIQATAWSKSSSYNRTVYRSVRLHGTIKGAALVYPWQIFAEVRHNDDSILLKRIIDNLTKFPTLRKLPVFIDFFVKTLSSSLVKRSNLVVRYLQALTDPYFGTTEHHFPSKWDLAKTINCSERSVLNFETVYSYLAAVQPRYLVNMGKLGFCGFRVIHQKSLSPIFEPFTLRCYPITPDRFLSILYLPPSSDLLDKLPGNEIAELTQYKIARNFEQLHAKPEQSWTVPVRLLGDSKIVIPPRRGIWFSLLPENDSSPRPLIDFNLLDQIQLISPGVYATLADTIGISDAYLRERMKKLLQEQVIVPFYFITRIGLDANILAVFSGTETEIKTITNDLLTFPYAEMFSGPNGGSVLLKIPAAWTPTFFEDVARLRKEGLDVWAVFAHPVISRWGIPLATIARKKEFFGFEWITEHNDN